MRLLDRLDLFAWRCLRAWRYWRRLRYTWRLAWFKAGAQCGCFDDRR